MFTSDQINGKWVCRYWQDGKFFASGEACDTFAEAHTSMMHAVADKACSTDAWGIFKRT